MKDDTQFSIYKIDTNKFLSIRDIEKLSVSQRTQEILKIMLSEIKQNIRQRENSQVENISIEGFVGIAYKTVNRPNWEGMITKLFQKMEGETLFDLENVNVSYILFYSIKESIYAMTAGYGSHLIKNYIEKSWGLYLMPKILGDNEGVIRVIKENNLYGNTLSMNKANRYTTNLEFEKKMSAVFNRKQLVWEIKNNVQQYVKQKKDLMNIVTVKGETKKWEEVKKIQEDWINRLVDQNSLDYQMIRSAVVIAGTCVGFLSNEVIKDMSFDYVIIDEAAKATTPELLVSIIKANKIILVGDQNQLPAYADAEVSPTLAKLTKNPDYRLFDILYNSLPDTHKQILTTQYRMIENIGNLISKVFYNGIIDTGCNDGEKRHGLSRYVGKSIVWFDTSTNKKKSQKRTKGGSYINEEEKRIILESWVFSMLEI